MEQHDTPEKTYDLERLIFFTDGVFAIVITLLVIDLRPPAGWDRTFAGLISAEWRALLAYGFSFVVVGAYWNAHRTLFRRVERFHPGLVVFNLLLLGLVVLVPFGSALIFETGPRGEPFVIYLSLVAAIGAAQALLWGFAAFVAKAVDRTITMRDRWIIFASLIVVPLLVFLAGLGVASGSTTATVGLVPAALAIGILRRRLLGRKPA
jgi:uncharacterized membrane protein